MDDKSQLNTDDTPVADEHVPQIEETEVSLHAHDDQPQVDPPPQEIPEEPAPELSPLEAETPKTDAATDDKPSVAPEDEAAPPQQGFSFPSEADVGSSPSTAEPDSLDLSTDTFPEVKTPLPEQEEDEEPTSLEDEVPASPFPSPSTISDAAAELLMDDSLPSDASIPVPQPPQAAPPQPAPQPIQELPKFNPDSNPGYVPNPINNPNVPSSIPAQAMPQPAQSTDTPVTYTQDLQQPPRQTGTFNRKKLLIFIGGALLLLAVIIIGVVVALGGEGENDEAPSGSDPAQITASDSRRKTDAGVLVVAIKTYTSDKKGKLLTVTPSNVELLQKQYLPESFTDPTTNEPYNIITDVPTTGEFQYVTGAQCGPDNTISKTEDDAQFAIRTLLENGNFYCVDS